MYPGFLNLWFYHLNQCLSYSRYTVKKTWRIQEKTNVPQRDEHLHCSRHTPRTAMPIPLLVLFSHWERPLLCVFKLHLALRDNFLPTTSPPSYLLHTSFFFSIIFIEHLLYIKHGRMPETQHWNQNFTFKQLRIYNEEQGSDCNNVHAIRETTKYSGEARKRNTRVSFECPRETRKEPLLGLGPGAEKGRNCWSKRKRNNSE